MVRLALLGAVLSANVADRRDVCIFVASDSVWKHADGIYIYFRYFAIVNNCVFPFIGPTGVVLLRAIRRRHQRLGFGVQN